ncbi:hypothetical protein STRMA_0627 [Streptococcus macacae NCTC 11558]|uniref:Uncharacterized protein n=1 Tax=Streptococcus macacae NCTC 11558 TaxID=764298 RepID=G5JU86_9STRE|nr:hypothetical protein STRMA_0627 [Streptococcus macacae NCTC 11558]
MIPVYYTLIPEFPKLKHLEVFSDCFDTSFDWFYYRYQLSSRL